MRLSRILRPEETRSLEETVSLRRAAFWALVGVALGVGVVLYFKYERLLVPLLG